MDDDFLRDLFSEFGAIEIKRMFSGRGIYARGAIFAIVARDGAIHFKTDDTTRAAYERENSKPLTFTKKSGQRMVTSYWRLPERLYDDPSELAEWAHKAVRVAQAFTAEKSTARKKAAPTGSGTTTKKAARASRKKSVAKTTRRRTRRA